MLLVQLGGKPLPVVKTMDDSAIIHRLSSNQKTTCVDVYWLLYRSKALGGARCNGRPASSTAEAVLPKQYCALAAGSKEEAI